MHVVCPSCHHTIELGDLDPAGEVACPACGSTFRLAGGSTTNWSRRRLGRFEVLGSLGGGAFGLVYKARDPSMDRVVAVKVPRAGGLAGPDEVERFLREARSAAQLRHPSIVTTHEVGTADGVPFLVSEFVEGVTLADYLSGKRAAARDAARLVAEAAEALHHAHTQGVVHRDVKPSNLMLVAKGGDEPHVKVMDFGLARRDAGEVTLTAEGGVLGTPAYMSPEQARGEGHSADGRTDVYSLGVVLYQMLTGELPFRGTARMLLHQVLHDEPRPPRALNDTLPRDLETITLKAMAKEPGRRYATAKELADDLARWLRGEPIQARPVTRLEKAWLWCRRNPLAAALAAGLAGLALALTLVAGLAAVHFGRLAEQERQVAGNERQLRGQAEAAEEQAKAERDAKDKALARSEGMRLVAQSEIVRPTNPGLALLLAIEGARRQDSLLANNALLAALEACREARTLLGHQAAVSDACFSPDGRRVLTASADRTARVWDAASGRLLHVLSHGDPVGAAWFSPDGRRVLTLAEDGTGRLWETETGKLLALLSRPRKEGDKPPGDGEDEVPLGLGYAGGFSPDGRRAVTAFGTPVVWDLDTGKELFALSGHTAWAGSAMFSPDGKAVLTGSADKTARLWDAATGQPRGVLRGHENPVVAARFSPDGLVVLTLGRNRISEDGNPTEMKEKEFGRLWDARTGKQVAALAWPRGWIGTPAQGAFSPDGGRVVTAGLSSYSSMHNGVRSIISSTSTYTDRRMGGPAVWEVKGGKYLRTLPLDDPWDRALAATFTPDGRFVAAVTTDGTARVWEVGSGREVTSLRGHRGEPTTLAASPDGRVLLTAGQDGTARLWDIAADEETPRKRGRWLGVQIAVLSPNGRLLATSAPWERDSPTVCLWDVASKAEASRLKGHTAKVQVARFSPDGTKLATSALDYTVRLWDVATGKPMHTFRVEGAMSFLEFSPDSRLLLIADRGVGAVRDVATGRLLASLRGEKEKGYVLSARFTPDSRRVVSTNGFEPFADGEAILTQRDFGTTALFYNRTNQARVWDVATGKELLALRPKSEGLGLAGAPLVSPDGRQAVVVAYSHKVGRESYGLLAWDLDTGAERASFQGHAGPVKFVRYSPDSRYVVTASRDKTARLWDARTGRELAAFKGHEAGLESASFSPDGEWVVTASRDRTARLWSARTRKHQATFVHSGAVFSATCTADGNQVLTLSEGGAARLWPIHPRSAAEGSKPRDLTAEERELFEVESP